MSGVSPVKRPYHHDAKQEMPVNFKFGSSFIFIAVLTFLNARTVADNAPQGAAARLLIMQPVNLQSNAVDPALGAEFRNIFSKKNIWEVIPLREMEKLFEEYQMSLNTPCSELTCTFDAGNIFHAKYAMFSTVTIFQEYYIFSFNLMDISITTVVWSEIGEILIKSGENPTEALVHRLSQLVENLDPAKLHRKKALSRGTLGILNLSEQSDYSKILFERLSTQVYLSGLYDLLGQKELSFLLESFGIQASKIDPTHGNLLSLGENLGVDFLIYSLLKKEEKEFSLQLALYDIKKKEPLREWPYRSSSFRDLLKFEDKFFSSLNVVETPAGERSRARKFSWKWVTVPVSLVAGGVMGYLAYNEHFIGNDRYVDWQHANSLAELQNRPALEREVKSARLKRNIYGGLGGICIAGSIVLFVF